MALEEHVGYVHPHSCKTMQGVCTYRHGRARVVQAHTVKEKCLGWEHPSNVAACLVHAPTAVEECTGWDHPQLWRSAQGGITYSCRRVHRVESPTAVEE